MPGASEAKGTSRVSRIPAAGTGSAAGVVSPAPKAVSVPAVVPGGGGLSGSGGAKPVAASRTRESTKASLLLMDEKRISILHDNVRVLMSFINHTYLDSLVKCTANPVPVCVRKGAIRLLEITRLMLNDNEDTYEELVSLYASMYAIKACIGIMIQNSGGEQRLFLCVNSNDDGTAARLMENGFLGHFPGSEIEELDENSMETIMEEMARVPSGSGKKYVETVSIVPSRRSNETENRQLKLSAQGIEKFMDSMSGNDYTVLFLAQPITPYAIDESKRSMENMFTMLSPFSKESVSYGENESDATNFSLSSSLSDSISENISRSYGTSHTHGTSFGMGNSEGSSRSEDGFGFNSGSCWNWGRNTSDGTSVTNTSGSSTSTTQSNSSTDGDSHTTGTSRTVNIQRDIKGVQNCMKRLETEIERIDTNRGFGMWDCCCYVISDEQDTARVAASNLQSLLCGDAVYGGSSYVNYWDSITERRNFSNVVGYLSYMQHPVFSYNAGGSCSTQEITPSLMVSGRDLPVLLSLPKRSVSGIEVLSMAEFGRNFPRSFKPKVPIEFGNIMHMGRLEPTKILFNKDAFASHGFICGAAGSGKSNTTYNLMYEMYKRKIPFTVIEPAKGEYKMEFAGMPGLQIFTCKPDNYRMLSINPFEFDPKVHIKEHLDHLNAVVTTCWPLYGPMPAMIKEAFEEAYIACGWDLELSERVIKKGKKFPTFADVLPAIERLIDSSAYSASEKGNYKGALCMRIKMLLTGFEGQIFGNTTGIPDDVLFPEYDPMITDDRLVKKTIIDLSNLGNPETRALIMGVLIIKLREYRFSHQGGTNSALKNLIIMEEAHNILKRCSHETTQDSGNVQGAAVGTLVDCIAEMRSCGQGFLIIDQSPGSVDEAALKNTAIKIVMRLPEENDCRAIGSTMSLNEEQISELSRLNKGCAVVYHEGWSVPVMGKMGTIWSMTAAAKAFKKNVQELNRTDFLRTKGAVVEWLCESYADDELDNFDSMTEFNKFLDDFIRRGYAPSMSSNIVEDIRDSFKQFITELKDQLEVAPSELEAGKVSKIMPYMGKFIRRLIQCDGIFRLNPLKLKDYKPENVRVVKGKGGPTPHQSFAIEMWWSSGMESMLGHYIQMPKECKLSNMQWTGNTMDGKYMKMACRLILLSFGEEYERSGSGSSVYKCAFHVLESTSLSEKRGLK